MRVVVNRWGMQKGMGITEGLVTVYAVLALWIIFALRPPAKETAPSGPAPGAAAP